MVTAYNHLKTLKKVNKFKLFGFAFLLIIGRIVVLCLCLLLFWTFFSWMILFYCKLYYFHTTLLKHNPNLTAAWNPCRMKAPFGAMFDRLCRLADTCLLCVTRKMDIYSWMAVMSITFQVNINSCFVDHTLAVNPFVTYHNLIWKFDTTHPSLHCSLCVYLLY